MTTGPGLTVSNVSVLLTSANANTDSSGVNEKLVIFPKDTAITEEVTQREAGLVFTYLS